MDELRQIIIDTLQECGKMVQANMDASGMNASGRTRDSVRVVVDGNSYMLVMGGENTAPMDTLESGREPGKVPTGFAAIIEQWSIDKGLDWGDAVERKRIAGAVAYGKIARVGFGRPAPSDFGSISRTIYTPVRELDVAGDIRRKMGNLIIAKITQRY